MDSTALYWMLLGDEPIKQVDVDVVGAIAAVLHVPMDDLFAVETTPNDAYARGEEPILGPDASRRMVELFDRGVLSESESAELQGLVATYSRLLHERRVREIAEKRGVSEEQVRRETEAAVAEVLDWLHAFNADPRHRQELAERVKRRQVGKTGS